MSTLPKEIFKAVKRLEIVAFRLRQELRGEIWTRRSYDADIIENEVIPLLTQQPTVQGDTAEGETPRTDAMTLWPSCSDDSDRPSPDGAYVDASFARTPTL